jgi:acid stress chaperone HdeB
MKASHFLFSTLLLSSGLAATTLPANALNLDLTMVKCRDFLTKSPEEIDVTLAWLDGFYMDEDASTVIDFDKLKENAGKLKSYCAAHPDVVLGAASEELFGK